MLENILYIITAIHFFTPVHSVAYECKEYKPIREFFADFEVMKYYKEYIFWRFLHKTSKMDGSIEPVSMEAVLEMHNIKDIEPMINDKRLIRQMKDPYYQHMRSLEIQNVKICEIRKSLVDKLERIKI